MIKEVFPFIIGYQDQSAIVDRALLQKYKNATLDELIKARLFKASLARALLHQDDEGMRAVLVAYNELTKHPYKNVEELKRAFGLLVVPQGVKRYLYL